METSADFYVVWRRVQGKTEEDALPLCPIAAELVAKLDQLIFSAVGARSSRADIARAKYLLQEEWQAWRKSLPHRHNGGILGRHRCLDEVYFAGYDRLHLLDLTTRPALSIAWSDEPAIAAVVPPPTQIAGIFIGDDEG